VRSEGPAGRPASDTGGVAALAASPAILVATTLAAVRRA
jgi:hypothetical protein